MSTSSLNQVKTMSNYGFYVSGNTLDPIFAKGKIESKPSISFYGSSLYIDYSNTSNISDLVYLKKTFGSFTAGVTFYIPPVQYYDGNNNIQTTIGGTAYFNKLINGDRVVVANIISGFTTPTNYSFFEKNNFIKNIEYNFSTSQSLTGYFLVNSMPSMSPNRFKGLGIIGSIFGFEEYISLDGGTAENADRLKVYGYCELKDGQEIIYFESGGTAQNLIETNSEISLYVRGDPDLITAPKYSSVPVVLILKVKNSGSVISCFENQSFNQAILRKNQFGAASYAYAIIDNCASCIDANYSDPVNGYKNDIGEFFNSLIFIKLTNSSVAFATSAFSATLNVASNPNIIIGGANNSIIKIDISHPSLIGYDLLIYSEPTRKTLLNINQFEKFGKLGYINSFAILKNYITNSTLYCTLQNSQTSAEVQFTIKV
jgi:hypothetical protein